MGQYYKAVLLNPETKKIEMAFCPTDGMKLMEHSWLRNNYVARVMCELEDKPMRVVWAGDYADDELTRICIKIKESQAAFEKGEIEQPLSLKDFESEIFNIKVEYARANDKRDTIVDKVIDNEFERKLALPLDELFNNPSENAKTLYDMVEEYCVCEGRDYNSKLKYIVNETRKQYVNITGAPKDNDGWQVHSLPLLTCEGNGRGSGDYRKEDNPNIGIWARDVIYTCRRAPKGYKRMPLWFESDM